MKNKLDNQQTAHSHPQQIHTQSFRSHPQSSSVSRECCITEQRVDCILRSTQAFTLANHVCFTANPEHLRSACRAGPFSSQWFLQLCTAIGSTSWERPEELREFSEDVNHRARLSNIARSRRRSSDTPFSATFSQPRDSKTSNFNR